MDIRVVDNFLPISFIEEIHEYVIGRHDDYVWRPNRIWDPGLTVGSPSILLMDVGFMSEKLLDFCSISINDFDLSELHVPYPVFYDAPINSYVNWHTEDVPLSISIYLNDEWKREWGGLFLYEHEGRVSGVIPRFNRAVISGPGIPHAVTTINPIAETNRYSLQLFFIERK